MIGCWDKAVQQLFGFLPPSLRGDFAELVAYVHPSDRDHVQQTIASAVAARRSFHIETRFVRPDGGIGWATLRAQPHHDAEGQPTGFIGVVQDTTERKALEGQLVHAQKLESIGQLAAGIAHEINTPTQYIGDNTRFLQDAFTEIAIFLAAYREVLRSVRAGPIDSGLIERCEAAAAAADLDYLSEEIPRAIQQSLEGVERVTKIVSAMKEFSHPGREERMPIDLNRAIESTITVARNEWKYVAELATDFDRGLPAVPGLPGELNQVVLNIIVNAAHAIAGVVGKDGKSKGMITVTTRRDGEWAEVRIADTGGGIPEAIRAKVFDPFFTTKDVGKGTGQGLAIARSVIVNKHGGTIHFESEMGRGTTFVIRLPLLAEAAPAGARPKGEPR